MTSGAEGQTLTAVRPPTVSVIVPIHNDAKHVSDAIRSLCLQTIASSIEVICIDDASTDNSLEILSALAAEYPNVSIHVESLEENSSAHIARRVGVLRAAGRYVMFLDADDELIPEACETLVREMDSYGTDVIQFGTEIIDSSQLGSERIERNLRALQPKYEELRGRDIVWQCFESRAVSWTVWSKIYRADLARAAFSLSEVEVLPKGQDVYETFLLLWHAESYRAIDLPLYRYRMAAGATAGNMDPLSRLRLLCTQSRVIRVLDKFAETLMANGEDGLAASLIQNLRDHFVNECATHWNANVDDSDAAAGFSLLLDAWAPLEVITWLRERVHADRGRVARRINGASALARTSLATDDTGVSNPETIGIFYHTMTIGGVQRVISGLIPTFESMGYSVVLITDTDVPEGEVQFDLPVSVRHVKIDNTGSTLDRVFGLRRAIAEEGINILSYHAASYDGLLYDMLAVKTLGVPFILSVHESFSHFVTYNSAVRPYVFALADAVQVLSEVEALYWKSFGVPAMYVQNPVRDFLAESADRNQSIGDPSDEPVVLWMGRFNEAQKQCTHLIKAFAEVVKAVPHAKLRLVGTGPEGLVKSLKNLSVSLGVDQSVEFMPPTTDVEAHLAEADAYMLTSTWETFGMAIVETKVAGLPLVLYDLPNQAVLEDGRGHVAVPQGDFRELGRQVVRVLVDKEYRRSLGEEARASVEPFLEHDLASSWRELIRVASVAGRETAPIPDDRSSRLIRRARDGSEWMIREFNSRIARAKKEASEQYSPQRVRRLEKSLEFKDWVSFVQRERISYLTRGVEHGLVRGARDRVG